MGIAKLSRRVEVCEMTTKRRLSLLRARGLVFSDPRRFYQLTSQGRSALGVGVVSQPWVDVARISAANRHATFRRGAEPLLTMASRLALSCR
jgi:DNA-binding IclR family transcriptional regulator